MKFKDIKLSEITEVITKGTTPTTLGFSFQSTGINFVKIESINENGTFNSNKFEHISEECNDKLKRSQLKENDILFSIAGAIGRVAVVTKEILPANTNQALAIIRLKDDSVSIPYLSCFLKSNFVIQQFEKKKQGVAQLNLSLKDIGDLVIKIPEKTVQNKIVQILHKVKSLVDNRQSQIAALDKLTKSVFLEMFGDPINNNKNLPKKKLGETGELKRGMSKHRPRNAPELLGGPYPLIQTGDVSRAGLFIESFKSTYSELGLKQSKMWDAGTLCITIAANIAETSILKFDACFPDSVVGYKPFEKMNTIFVHFWFSFFQKILENSAPESAQKNINLKILNDIEIITPSLEQQNEFANKVLVIYEQKLKLEEGKNFMEELYNLLLNKAFKGELFQVQG